MVIDIRIIYGFVFNLYQRIAMRKNTLLSVSRSKNGPDSLSLSEERKCENEVFG